MYSARANPARVYVDSLPPTEAPHASLLSKSSGLSLSASGEGLARLPPLHSKGSTALSLGFSNALDTQENALEANAEEDLLTGAWTTSVLSAERGDFAHVRPAEALALYSIVDSLVHQQGEEARLCMLDGEAGMGRSTAAAYFRDLARSRGLPCVSVSALRGDEAVPYGMFARLLGALIGEPSLLTEETQRQALSTAVAAHLPEEEREATVGALKAMLRLAWTGDPQVRPAVLNARLSTAGIQRLAQGLLGARCCVAVDDAHLADELSWGELELLATRCVGVVFLVTALSSQPPPLERRSFEARSQLGPGATFDADQELTAHPSDACLRMSRLPRCLSLRLAALPDPALALLLESLPAAADAQMSEAAAGSPFWALFLERFVDDYGLEECRRVLASGGPGPRALVLVLVDCALARLAPEVAALAALCSTVGEVFTLALLLELAAPLDMASVLDSLDVLVAKRYLKAVQGRHIGEQTYEFAHPLLRKTIYDRVPMGEAAEGHLRVAEYLEREYKADLRPYFSRLTYHYGKCQGRRTDAFKYMSKAANEAIKRGAYSHGLVSAQIAANMAVSGIEYRILLAACDRALDELVSRHAAAAAQSDQEPDNPRMDAYRQLQETLKSRLIEVTRPAPEVAPLVPSPPNFESEAVISYRNENDLIPPGNDCCTIC